MGFCLMLDALLGSTAALVLTFSETFFEVISVISLFSTRCESLIIFLKSLLGDYFTLFYFFISVLGQSITLDFLLSITTFLT